MAPFDEWEFWKEHISKPVKHKSKVGAMRVRSLMNYSTMRRLKSQKVNGKPIIVLPPRSEEIVVIPLTRKEKVKYREMFVSILYNVLFFT